MAAGGAHRRGPKYPRGRQDDPRGRQESPKRAQDGPKRVPRRLQGAKRASRGARKWLENSSQICPCLTLFLVVDFCPFRKRFFKYFCSGAVLAKMSFLMQNIVFHRSDWLSLFCKKGLRSVPHALENRLEIRSKIDEKIVQKLI